MKKPFTTPKKRRRGSPPPVVIVRGERRTSPAGAVVGDWAPRDDRAVRDPRPQ